MGSREIKIVFIAISCSVLVLSILLNPQSVSSLKIAIGYPVVFLFGLHLCYSFIFNTKMYAQGVSAEANQGQPIVRKFYGVAGVLIMSLCVYGVWF